jgi:UDP:flavonoid glycosyltransferase YjiC (YdhE family)
LGRQPFSRIHDKRKSVFFERIEAMKRILALATAGAGGDLQPLMAVALQLASRGHELVFSGDPSVAAIVQPLGIETVVAPPEHDLGPRLMAAIRDAQGLEQSVQGDLVRHRMALWSAELAPAVQRLIRERKPDLLLTSLFGTSVASLACSPANIPWGVINSTFYIGPDPPRTLESDFAPRAVPLMRYFLAFLEEANLVLHATDQIFDYNYTHLPNHHRYVGPLIWEAEAPVPGYLDEPGDPWILVTISSQLQDDLPLARAALNAVAYHPVRVALTLGGGHQPTELGQVPGNARVEQYIPHSRVLARCRLLISHAGHGSVMKALWYGVPMVLMPWGRDQPGVATRAEHLGVAKVIVRDQVTDEGLADAVQLVLEDQHIREAASEVARRLQTQDPVATACDFLEQV